MATIEQKMEYYRAFYGDGIRESNIENLPEKEFSTMVTTFNADLINRFPALDADYELRKRCIITGLRAMHALDADHPNVYLKHSKFTNEAMLAASGVYNGQMSAEKTSDSLDEIYAISDSRIKELDDLDRREAAIYSHYEGLFQKLHAEEGLGTIETKVNAYLNLIAMDEYSHPEGKAYYVVAWKLPIELGIYENERVIEAMQNHPSFHGMQRQKGGTKMRVNGMKATDVFMNPNVT